MATNICKGCAIEILKSYKFRLKYIESEGKLRKMLGQSKEQPNKYKSLFDVEVNIEETGNVLQTMLGSSGTAESRWKCNPCLSTFASRLQYQDHRRLYHSNAGSGRSLKKINENGQKGWKCDHCSATFRTKKLKLKHEGEQHHLEVNNSGNSSMLPMKVYPLASDVRITDEPSILIHDDDSDNDGFFFPNITEVNVDIDENEFADQEPEMDLGLYMLEKHNQINGFDPLEVNNSSSSLLIPMTVYPSVLKNEVIDDFNSKWKCRVCKEKFRTRDLLREHNHLHMASKRSPIPSPKQVMKIEKINFMKNDNADTASDKKPVVDKKPKDPNRRWQCKTCLLVFETRELLRIHRRNYYAKKETSEVKEDRSKNEKPGDAGKALSKEEKPIFPEARKVYPGAKKRKIEQPIVKCEVDDWQ